MYGITPNPAMFYLGKTEGADPDRNKENSPRSSDLGLFSWLGLVDVFQEIALLL